MLGDWEIDSTPVIASLLDDYGLEVLVYSGENDWVCNWRGGEAWTNATKWKYQSQFNKQNYRPLYTEGKQAGSIK